MTDLVKTDKEKNDALTRIQKFMSNEESGVALNVKEEQMLSRWIFCNALLKERKWKEDQIIDKLMAQFSVSKYTARADINRTRSLFVSLVQDLKKYTLHRHIEDIEHTIEKWKLDKSLAPFVPKLMDSLTRAVQALPDETLITDVPAPVVNIITGGLHIHNSMTAAQAMKEADDLIDYEKNHEYTEFDDVDDKPGE